MLSRGTPGLIPNGHYRWILVRFALAKKGVKWGNLTFFNIPVGWFFR